MQHIVSTHPTGACVMRTIGWLTLLTSLCGVLGEDAKLGVLGHPAERIDRCGIRCSQGLQCKIKPRPLFSPPCQKPPEGLDAAVIFQNVSLSTVMSCRAKQKCSLHLRVSGVLHLTEPVHGVSVCTESAGMFGHCQLLSFSRSSRLSLAGHQVKFESDCLAISPSQQVQVTVKTLPDYCGVTWTGTFHVPDCRTADLRTNIPECITGQLSYKVNPEKNELVVKVSEMLEDKDYHLRLCLKDFICLGTGVSALIKKEDPLKTATLVYSRALPCLCLEGWSDVVDASRVQVCPFSNRLEELWSGVNFDPIEEVLSWEPACPVSAVVSLCQKEEANSCVDLPKSSRSISREKITFKVDPHPQLCMKFKSGSESWTKCPFADGRFQAWELSVRRGAEGVEMLSTIAATLSVGMCELERGATGCRPADEHTVSVEKQVPVVVCSTGNLCKPNTCLQVKRQDVEHAVTVLYCDLPCLPTGSREGVSSQDAGLLLPHWEVTWVVIPTAVVLFVIIITTLVLHLVLTVYQRRTRYAPDKPTETHHSIVVPAIQNNSWLNGESTVPDSPQDSPKVGCTERANLLRK